MIKFWENDEYLQTNYWFQMEVEQKLLTKWFFNKRCLSCRMDYLVFPQMSDKGEVEDTLMKVEELI